MTSSEGVLSCTPCSVLTVRRQASSGESPHSEMWRCIGFQLHSFPLWNQKADLATCQGCTCHWSPKPISPLGIWELYQAASKAAECSAGQIVFVQSIKASRWKTPNSKSSKYSQRFCSLSNVGEKLLLGNLVQRSAVGRRAASRKC